VVEAVDNCRYRHIITMGVFTDGLRHRIRRPGAPIPVPRKGGGRGCDAWIPDVMGIDCGGKGVCVLVLPRPRTET
jgi:hypothetical protein